MRNNLFSVLILFFATLAFSEFDGRTVGAQSPNNAGDGKTYYHDIDDSGSGSQLRSNLNRLIRNHRRLKYGELWRALAYTDADEKDSSKVVLFYTGWRRSKNDHGAGAHQWNREHVWAKSKGDFGTDPGAGTDLHHIRPTDVSVNKARGSLSFDTGGRVYKDPDGATTNRVDRDSWEPRDEVKGDVARMMFYMAVRYEAGLDLKLVSSAVPQFSRKPIMGKLSTLLKWHAADPVSAFEKRRNDRIHKVQGNRNPFIDHPEWVKKIWR